jgi:hypothetical protein
MRCGDCFLMPAPGLGPTPHLWILLTEPAPECVIVSITTLREGKDQTVILQRGDHPFVRHQTCIFYGDARIVNVASIRGFVVALDGSQGATVLSRMEGEGK